MFGVFSVAVNDTVWCCRKETEEGSGRFEWKHANSNQAATDNTLLSPMSVCVCVLLSVLLYG